MPGSSLDFSQALQAGTGLVCSAALGELPSSCSKQSSDTVREAVPLKNTDLGSIYLFGWPVVGDDNLFLSPQSR